LTGRYTRIGLLMFVSSFKNLFTRVYRNREGIDRIPDGPRKAGFE
jgi:hypothetical protein